MNMLLRHGAPWLAAVALCGTPGAARPAEAAAPAVYFISPTGADTQDGRSEDAPVRTFARAFALMQGGDALVLLDGSYGDATGTGRIGGSPRNQPPLGMPQRATLVYALHPGRVRVAGDLSLGLKGMKSSRVTIRGISFSGGADLYNTAFVTLKDCGFQDGLYVGTNDHDEGNTDDLIEDVWVRAAGRRIIAENYRADRNVWRRVVIRGDGCGTEKCRKGGGHPNVGITVYESVDVSLQNVIVVDRVLAPGDEPYADFAVAAHDTSGVKMGRAEWLGVMSLNAPDDGFNMDPDGPHAVVAPTLTLRDAVVARPAGYGMYFGKAGIDDVFENITVVDAGGAGVVADESLTHPQLRNVLVSRVKGNGVYFTPGSRYDPEYVFVEGAGKLPWAKYSKACKRGCPAAGKGPALRHVTRVEAAFLRGKGADGRDIGAHVEYRYGEDGTRFGEPGYRTLTRKALWPWPNEDRLREDLCAGTQPPTTRGLCRDGMRLDGSQPVSFTSYVWELLGQAMPADLRPR